MLVGYVGSTREGASHAAEDAALRDAGCDVVFTDQCESSAAEPRTEFAKALESLKPQDVLLVTGFDRLAGGLRELIARMLQVQAKGASVRTLRGCVDTHTANSKELLEALLSFEKDLAGARIHQGMKVAQQQGQHVGRPRLLDTAAVRLAAARAEAGEPVPRIARSLGVAAQTLRRALNAER